MAVFHDPFFLTRADKRLSGETVGPNDSKKEFLITISLSSGVLISFEQEG